MNKINYLFILKSLLYILLIKDFNYEIKIDIILLINAFYN